MQISARIAPWDFSGGLRELLILQQSVRGLNLFSYSADTDSHSALAPQVIHFQNGPCCARPMSDKAVSDTETEFTMVEVGNEATLCLINKVSSKGVIGRLTTK